MSGRPRQPNDPNVISSLESAVREIRRPGPFERAFNWRWELGIAGAIAGVAWIIAAGLGLVWLAAAAGAGLVAIGALLRWPPARKRIVARAWCIITPHRVRVGCLNAWVQTRSGSLPVILATTPADFGERVHVWCRAGITAADLLAANDILAASCWATEVRVIPSARYAHIVTLEVVRDHHAERPAPSPQDWPFSRHGESNPTGEDPEEPALVAPLGEPAGHSVKY
jgi:hypothetical protein